MTEEEMKELARDIARTYVTKMQGNLEYDIDRFIKTYIKAYKSAIDIIKEDKTLNIIADSKHTNREFDLGGLEPVPVGVPLLDAREALESAAKARR